MQNLQPEDASQALKVSYSQASALAPSRKVQSCVNRDGLATVVVALLPDTLDHHVAG